MYLRLIRPPNSSSVSVSCAGVDLTIGVSFPLGPSQPPGQALNLTELTLRMKMWLATSMPNRAKLLNEEAKSVSRLVARCHQL